MEYKGYTGTVEYDSEAETFLGEVLHLRDVVTFQGTTVAELKKAFQDSVDDYLEYCEKKGVAPEKPYSGNVLVRLSPALHRDVAGAAARAGESLNKWISMALSSYLTQDSTELGQDPPETFVESFDLSVAEDSLSEFYRIHHPIAQHGNKVYNKIYTRQSGRGRLAVKTVKVIGEAKAREIILDDTGAQVVQRKGMSHVC